jgi:hypothetical protein
MTLSGPRDGKRLQQPRAARHAVIFAGRVFERNKIVRQPRDPDAVKQLFSASLRACAELEMGDGCRRITEEKYDMHKVKKASLDVIGV